LLSLVPLKEESNTNPDIFIVCLGDTAKIPGFQAAHELRLAGFQVERDYEMASMKSQMRKANKSNCRFALIIGENEISSGKYILKNMAEGDQYEINSKSLSTEMTKQVNTNN
jgi:histidyl-tRNA synthetase